MCAFAYVCVSRKAGRGVLQAGSQTNACLAAVILLEGRNGTVMTTITMMMTIVAVVVVVVVVVVVMVVMVVVAVVVVVAVMVVVAVVVAMVGTAEEPMQFDRVHDDGPAPAVLMRWEVRRGKGPLRACKGGRNPYAPFCRDREERRRASRLSRNSQGRVAGGRAEADGGAGCRRRSVPREW